MTEEQANQIIYKLEEILQSNTNFIEEFVKRIHNIEYALRFFQWIGAAILFYLVIKFLWWLFSKTFFGGI